MKQLIAEKTEKLKNAPKGKLYVSTCNGHCQFLIAADNGDRKYLSKQERTLIKALAQKDYDQKVIASARSELSTLSILLKKYDAGIAEDIFEKLTPARRNLTEPIMMPDDAFIEKWLSEPYNKAGFDVGDPEFFTSKGLRVRSKSEIIFAEKYDEYNIPYKYECPLYLEGYGWVRPDFTALKIKYRQTVYHEHLGMMDDSEYAERNINKIHAYEQNGFVIGRDLILTFETRNNPIGPADAEKLIKTYLV